MRLQVTRDKGIGEFVKFRQWFRIGSSVGGCVFSSKNMVVMLTGTHFGRFWKWEK